MLTIAYGKTRKEVKTAPTGNNRHIRNTASALYPHHRTGRSDHRRRNDAVRKTQPSPADRPMGRPAADYRSERTTRLSEKQETETIKTYYDMKKYITTSCCSCSASHWELSHRCCKTDSPAGMVSPTIKPAPNSRLKPGRSAAWRWNEYFADAGEHQYRAGGQISSACVSTGSNCLQYTFGDGYNRVPDRRRLVLSRRKGIYNAKIINSSNLGLLFIPAHETLSEFFRLSVPICPRRLFVGRFCWFCGRSVCRIGLRSCLCSFSWLLSLS